jgi:cation diffusion facilitator CzcD-associated flavoprotein CzcO
MRVPRPGSGSAPRVAIIGAGLGGVATAVKLKQAGIEDFVVFETSSAPGGTWWENRYPGCEVDVPSQLYSYSFIPYDWTRSYAGAAELQRYVEDVIDHFGIRENFRFSCPVQAAVWDEDRSVYELQLADGERHAFTAVVSCVGFLNQPRYPEWPGLDDFAGPRFHTARWEHEHDLAGKTVALVGTGSTAIQIAANVAEVADHLYVYQREPGWIFPKRVTQYRPVSRAIRRRVPPLQRAERIGWWFIFDFGLRWLFTAGSRANKLTEKLCRKFIAARVEDPAVRDAVTPTYPVGCKRVIFDDTFYRALNRPNVTLVPHAVTEVTRQGLIAADGAERPADVLLMATGFKAQDYLSTLRVRGRDGRDLHETWAGEPRAFLGIAMPGFPNFFMVYGPNTNGGNSIIFQLERQAEVVAQAMSRLRRTGAAVIETSERAFGSYDTWISGQVDKRFTAANFCHNYYFSPTGRNVTQWPRGGLDYWALTRVLPRVALRTGRAR